jgi:hypothetical protein
MSLEHRSAPKTALYKKFKIVLISSGLGSALFLGFVLSKEQRPSLVGVPPARVPTTTDAAASNKTSAISASKPALTTASPKLFPSETGSNISPDISAASSNCGDPIGSGDVLYPVVTNRADVEQSEQQSCRPAIAKTSVDGTPASQVAGFTDRQRAAAFAQKVGGKVGQPYQLPPLPSSISIDSSASSLPSSSLPSQSEAEIDAAVPGNRNDNDAGSRADTPSQLAPFVFASPAPALPAAPSNSTPSSAESP